MFNFNNTLMQVFYQIPMKETETHISLELSITVLNSVIQEENILV